MITEVAVKLYFNKLQVVTMCKEVLEHRDEQVRKEYEKELSTRKMEQFDAFLKFADHELKFTPSNGTPTCEYSVSLSLSKPLSN